MFNRALNTPMKSAANKCMVDPEIKFLLISTLFNNSNQLIIIRVVNRTLLNIENVGYWKTVDGCQPS